MRAVVMAGGEGSRLRPLTSGRPKPLVPVGNRPIMEHIVRHLARHGVDDIVATLYYLGEEIVEYFADGSDFGVRMRYSTETVPLGTAGSVKKAEAFLRDGTFLIVSGDALTDLDIGKALAYHREKGAVATLILARVPNPLEFGVVVTDDEGRIQRFLEKPTWSEVFSDTVNTGMYILEPEILDLMQPDKSYDWSSDIFPQLLEEGRPMVGYIMEDYWADVGSLSQYREAQEDLLSGKVDLPIPGEEWAEGIFCGANTTIDPAAILVPPVCLGRNVRIKALARVGPYTCIGDSTTVEEGANVDRSVIWEGAYIGYRTRVHSAIVCSRAMLKRDVTVNEDSVVGDRSALDAGATIAPRVKIFPDKMIERGARVTMSVVTGGKWRGNLFRELGVAGLSNLEITPDFACRLGAAFGSVMGPPCRIITSRDSTRSSRMIKRAIISSLLSVGCDVLDLRSAALPVARHFIKASGAAGAIAVRKLPGNQRVTLVEMFDSRGAYLSRKLERKVESAFFREDYNRTDPDDLGQIEFASRAVEEYQTDFFRHLGEHPQGRRLKVVCDYGYSSFGTFYPAMLERLNVESISLNAFNDAKRAPRNESEIETHTKNLGHIVGTLGYDLGVLFTQEGERMTVVDGAGNALGGTELLGVLSSLVADAKPGAVIALSIIAPDRLESVLEHAGASITRSKTDIRSLLEAGIDGGADMAGDEHGGFAFPALHPGFDAAYAFARLITMLSSARTSLHDRVAELPRFFLAKEFVAVGWETRGALMRRLAERASGNAVETVDGLKVRESEGWVLIRPDVLEPVVHLHVEAIGQDEATELASKWAAIVRELSV
jgi:mannose-1-phosphate guanylyltransferase/phosphomannomutase